MDRNHSSQEVNFLDYPWGQMASGDCHDFRKSSQGGHFYGNGNFSRDVAIIRFQPIDNQTESNRSLSLSAIDKRCHAMSGSESSPNELHKTTLHETTSDIKESNLDSHKIHETKSQGNNPKLSSTQTENIERLYHTWLTSIYNSMSCNSTMSTMFAMLVVGAGMHSPPRLNPIPRIIMTSPGGHELRLSPLSPPKSPTRSPRESIERIKAFPKIPKRQFTTPEKSPEKKELPLRAWNRQTSVSSTTTTSTASEEEIPCGGFRLASPSKVFRPPRDPFAIPEKFELAPSSSQSFDFSKGPQMFVFPSLIFPEPGEKPQDEKGTSQPSEDVSLQLDPTITEVKFDQDQSNKVVKCDQEATHIEVKGDQESTKIPVVPGIADNKSGSPEKDKRPPKSLFNPNSVHFSTGDTEVPIAIGGSKNLNKLTKNVQLNEIDPLQQPAQDAMKEFDHVYGQYTGHLDHRISKKLHHMEEFIAKVRRKVLRTTDFGAIVSTMHLTDAVSNSMGRINRITDRLKLIQEELTVKSKYSYWQYTNLKHRPFTTYQQGKGSTRLDDIHALRTTTKELSDMLTEAEKLIESYRTDKKYVKKYVFGEK